MQKNSVNWIGLALLVGFGLALLYGWISTLAGGGHGEEASHARTFLLRLPEDKAPQLERPAVAFDHEAHTKALEDESCESCHKDAGEGKLIYTMYDPAANLSRDALADTYHDKCIKCHTDRGQGPTVCGQCHVRGGQKGDWYSMDLDLKQHDKHVQAMDGKCESCHHVYDQTLKKLVYEKGKESACRDCHKNNNEGDIPQLRTVAHEQCVTCHRRQSLAGAKAGPVDCGGCHDAPPAAPTAIADMSGIERLVSGQKDAPIIKVKNNTMPPVAFNHKAHESVTRKCGSCHHQSLKACKNCHTLEGAPEGGGVKLADAYHDADSTHSCVGCHEQKKKEKNCAACHVSMPAGPTETTCLTCHSEKLDRSTGKADMARRIKGLLPDEADIEVSSLKDKFQPVAFPHTDIVLGLNGLIQDDGLANAFHGGRMVMCNGCHHHSPEPTAAQGPPKCSRCHQAPFDPRTLTRPGLKGAYHQLCIGCHRAMDASATKIADPRACAGCHKDNVAMPGKPVNK